MTQTADYELQMFSRNHAELKQFWRGMQRLLVGLVSLGAALSLAAQHMPGVPAGNLAPPFRARDQFAKEQTLSSLMGPNGLVLLFFRSADW
ncbi:MAG: hypothetical protein WBV55_04890 [Candidatus Sulfotelmatobacter sp.]